MNADVNRKVQERNLDILTKNKGFQFTDTFFPYTSGQIGPYYIQSVVVENSGSDYKRACDDFANLVNSNGNFDVISGGESRDWDFSNVLSYILSKPHMKIYKNGKTLGAENIQGKSVAHVADLNNEGSSIRDLWMPAIQKAGGIVRDVFFYVDRLEDGVNVVDDLKLNSYAVVPLDQYAWDYLQEKGVITKEVHNSLSARMQDKDSWAKNMLRSDKGIGKFVELALDINTRPKVDKIMNKGYPEMKEDLVSVLMEKTDIDIDVWEKGM